MKRSEIVNLIQRTLDNNILNIPNDYYIVREHREDYASYLLQVIERALPIGWDIEELLEDDTNAGEKM